VHGVSAGQKLSAGVNFEVNNATAALPTVLHHSAVLNEERDGIGGP